MGRRRLAMLFLGIWMGSSLAFLPAIASNLYKLTQPVEAQFSLASDLMLKVDYNAYQKISKLQIATVATDSLTIYAVVQVLGIALVALLTLIALPHSRLYWGVVAAQVAIVFFQVFGLHPDMGVTSITLSQASGLAAKSVASRLGVFCAGYAFAEFLKLNLSIVLAAGLQGLSVIPRRSFGSREHVRPHWGPQPAAASDISNLSVAVRGNTVERAKTAC